MITRLLHFYKIEYDKIKMIKEYNDVNEAKKDKSRRYYDFLILISNSYSCDN